MALPKRSRKAWIQFGIAVAIALIFGVIAVGVMFMLFGGLNAQNSQLQKRFNKEKASLEKQINELSDKLNQQPEAVVQQQVVIKAAAPAGKPLTTEVLEVATLEEGKQPAKEGFPSLAGAIGEIPARNLFPGEVLTKDKLLNTDNMLPVDNGKRAIAVQANALNLLGGAIFEGAHVDVLATFKEPAQTRTILSDIRVLKAPSRQRASSSKTRSNTSRGLMTLEVTPAQAEILALAARESSLHMTLRPFGDTNGKTQAPGVDLDHLAYGPGGNPAKQVAPPPVLESTTTPPAANSAPEFAPSQTVSIEIWRGATNETTTFTQE